MKKFAFALAAGVLAAGVSAQAAEVSSAEYAVITIPVAPTNNLIGISVEADAASLADVVKGLPGGATVKSWNGKTYDTSTVGEITVSKGDSVFVEVQAAGKAYELGVAPSESAVATNSLSVNMDVVAPPFADAWSLDDVWFSTAGGNRISVANKVHIWNGSGYDTYWYKKSNDAKEGWYLKGNATKLTAPPSFGAGQAFFVELGNGTSTKPTSGIVTIKP